MAEELTNDIENVEYELGELKMYLAYSTDPDPFYLMRNMEELEMYIETMMDTFKSLCSELRKETV